MEAICPFETLVDFKRNPRHYIFETKMPRKPRLLFVNAGILVIETAEENFEE
jgi:hypothetical protein